MKHLLLRRLLPAMCFLMVLAAVPAAWAQYTPGNLVVLRVGDGTAPLSASATAVNLVEYGRTAGPATNTLPLPTAASGVNYQLTESGSAGSEGALNLSADGRFLTLVGYDAAVGSGAVVANTTYNRVIGRVDNARNINTTTILQNASAYSGNNIRAAVSADGTQFWTSGNGSSSTGGVRYVPLGNTTGGGTQLNSTLLNTRVVNIYNGQLYVSSSTGSFTGVSGVGTGLPTTSGQAITLLAGAANAYAFFFLDRDPAVPGPDLLYVADQSAGILKFSYNGSAWTARGAIAGGVTGLTGFYNCVNNNVELYATVGTSAGNTLFKTTDNAAYNATVVAGTSVTLGTAPANTAFRGVAFAPGTNVNAPTAFNATGGGAYCGTTAIPVGLSGSEIGISYQLLSNGTPSGSPLAGTGGALAFPGQTTAGTYTVVATNTLTGCPVTMAGSAVVTVNTPTPANAGPAQTITAGSSVTLAANTPTTGTGSWSVTSGPSTSSAQFSSTTDPMATFTPAGGAGSYILTWTISNAPCAPSASNVTITVTPAAQPDLTVALSSPASATAGLAYSYSLTVGNGGSAGATGIDLSFTLPAGVTYNTASVTNGFTAAQNGSVVTFTGGSIAQGSSAGLSVTVVPVAAGTLTVSPGAAVVDPNNTIAESSEANNSSAQTVTTTVAGACPAISAALSGTTTICANTSTTLAVSLSGGTSPYSVTYSDGTGTFVTGNYASGAPLTVSPTTSTTYSLVAVTDASGCTATVSGSASVSVTPATTPANAGPAQTIAFGTSATLAANTPVNGTGTWSVASGPSTGMSQFSDLTSPTSTFAPAGGAGQYVLTWTISNPPCASSASNVTITVMAANLPPTAPTLTSQTGIVAVPFAYTVPAFIDPEGQAVTYTITGVPAGLLADNITRVISGTPTTPGTSTVTVVASDPQSMTTAGTFTITINANQAPMGSAVASHTATVGVGFSLTIPAFADPENQTLTYAAMGVPAPLAFDPVTRVLSGTPTTAGISTIVVMATDPAGNTASTTFSLSVDPAPVTPAGVIRITEYMYSSNNGAGNGAGEFVELTNVGNAPIDLTGWSLDDNTRIPGSFTGVSAFGVVQPNESVIITDATAAQFRLFWYLPTSVKVAGGNDQNLGRADEINIYDASGALVDRLSYNDQGSPMSATSVAIPSGSIRTNGRSGWPQRQYLGTNNISNWQLSVADDAQNSYLATTGDLGNPGGYFMPLPRIKVVESGGATAVTEGGTTDTYTIALNSPPTADVTVTINPGTQLTVSSPTLTFTPANYNTAQTVTVTAIDDAVYQGAPRSVTITQSVASSDAAYNSLPVNPVSVTITDNDVAATAPPTVQVAGTTTPFLSLPAAGPGYVSGVIGDPTDPASVLGINFTLADTDTPIANLTVTVGSSNAAVVPAANLLFSGTDANRTLKITPAGVGYATLTVSVTDGSNTAAYVINYAASAASATQNTTATRFHTGTSDASTATAVDPNYTLVGDDENQVLRLYSRQSSGLPVAGFDYTTSLGLTDVSGGVPREVDIEASIRQGNRIFWFGSESNADGGAARPNRDRVFATDVAGSGVSTTLSYVGRYDFLREDIINWDVTSGHGKGVNYYGLQASAAANVPSKQASGYNIEGAEFAPDNSTVFLGFRAPQVLPASRTKALIVPVTNLTGLVNGQAQGSAQFGAPIELDLGGRGIREIRKNSSNQYIIIAGPAGDAGAAPNDFRLYTWTGNAADAPVLRTADLTSLNANGSFESIVDVPGTLTNASSIELLVDNGDAVYYADGTIAKDLAQNNFKKFRSDVVTLGAPVNTAPVATANNNQTATVGVLFSYTVNAFTDAETPNNLTYSASISPANSLSFDAATRIVSGTPSATGVSTVTITATDPGSLSASTSFTITVNPAPVVVTSLSLTASANPTTLLTTGTTTLSATVMGGTVPYSYSFSGPGTITASGNTAMVSNLPVGVQTFTVVAADATSPTNQTISATVSVTVTATPAVSTTGIVISQVYGGGGNSGAPYKSDYIELFNRTNAPININGWSVQYAAATNPSWAVTPLTGTIPAGGYYLISEATNTTATSTSLPPSDASGTINLSGTAGKVALVSSTTPLSGTCPTGISIIDFVGFGATANCFEGTGPTPAPSNTVAIFRAMNGCTDANQNATDFATAAPAPRNSMSPLNVCGATVASLSLTASASPTTLLTTGTTTLSATVSGGTTPYSYSFTGPGSITANGNTASVSNLPAGVQTFTVVARDATSPTSLSISATVSVTVNTPAPVNTAPVATTNANQVTTINVPFAYTVNAFTDDTPNSLTYTASISPANSLSFDVGTRVISGTPSMTGVSTVTITATDPGNLSASTTFTITVNPAPTTSLPGVVISQVYGGGGNTGATYKNDYIELFNRTNAPISINGWSVQYTSAAGTSWAPTSLTGTIPAGGYYLIQEAAGTGGTTNLPTPDAIGTLALSGTAGKIALVSSTSPLSGSCPTGGTIVDFVGFGTANCFEGTGPTPAPSNSLAVLRVMNGCTDTNQNAADFATGAPAPRNSMSPLNVCGAAPAATLTATPSALTGLNGTAGMVSATQTYTLTGANLDGSAVSVAATAGVELSTDNVTFATTLSLPVSASAIAQVVYVRLTNASPSGAFSGTITNTANSTLVALVSVSGNITAANAPTLSASPGILSGFTTTQGMASAVQTYTLTGVNLTTAITVSAPAGYQVSQDGSNFQDNITVTSAGSSVTALISVRLTGVTPGSFTGSVTNTTDGANPQTVRVSGMVSSTAPVSAYTPIATARAGINSTFTIAGRVTVSNQLGARQIYIQDATGGIAVYSGQSGPDFTTLVNIGDSVQVRGPVTVFSGYLELTGTGNFTAVAGAGSRVPTPIAITPNQLANYQGRLVSIADAIITPVAGSFSGGTSYTITAGGQSNTLRISANSPLSGAGQPANPVSVTGIADRFVSGATTTGNDALQLQPRILADIPGSTPATDLTCTVGSGSPLTRDQTLDIAAWNMEFFGADAGTITCPGNKTLVYNDMGPVNEDLQQTNATQVLTRLNADIISAEEVSDINRFAAAVAAIPGSYSYVCSDKFSYFFQDECDQVPSGTPPTVFGPTKFAQKVCVIYNTATVTPILAETKPLLFKKTPDYTYPGELGGNGNGSGWASGRLPFLFVANVTINGVTKKIHVVAVHGKSGSAKADFDRRVQDYNDLKAELDQNYPTANVVILGDYNDKATSSIYTNSPISSFNSFVTDVTNYSVVSKPLEQNGCVTYNPSGGSFIDQIIISNDLQRGYLTNSAYVLQPFSIPNYGNTTSDHSPIEARFDISQLAGTTTALSLSLTASPTTLLTTGTTTLSATVSGGTTPYSYSFTGPGSITANGNTASVSNLPAGVQTFTVVARDATSPTSQTLSATVSVTVSAPAPVNTAPVATTNASQTATVGQLFTYTVNAFSDTETPTSLTYTASISPANSLSFDAGTRVISGTPSMTGVSTVTITATDPGSLSASTSFTITVSPALVVVTSLSLTASATPTTLLTTGTTTLSATVSGGSTPYSYSFTGPGSITANGNTAMVSNLPAGVQTFTVVARDATSPTSQTISATVSVTVNTPVTPTIVVSPTALTNFVYTTQVDGSAAQSYTVSASGLSSALSITASGSYQVSLDNYFFSKSLTIPATNGTVLPTQVYVILSGNTAGSYTGTVTNNSGSATATVAVSGTILQATLMATPTALSNFTTTVGTPSAIQTYTLTTLNQMGVTVFAPSGVQIRTGSNPFSSSLTIGASLSTISVPVDVRLSGTSTGPVAGTIVHLPANGDNRLPTTLVAINGSVSPVVPTGPATLTITSFNCFSSSTGALSSVNFVVGYSNGGFTPALPPLFINGVTDNGMLGQAYSFGFDANASTLSVQDNANRSSTYFVWNFRQACAGPVTPPAMPTPTPPVAPVLANQPATQGSFFSYVVPAFTGTGPISYTATGLPAGLSFDAPSRTISGTPTTVQTATVTIQASNTVGQSSGTFTIAVSASATQPTSPATLTITSFNCFSSSTGALSSVNFVVGTATAASPPPCLRCSSTG